MPSRTPSQSRAPNRLVWLSAGLALMVQTEAWHLLATPLGGGGDLFDLSLAGVVAFSLLLGAVLHSRKAGRRLELFLALAGCLGTALAWILAPRLLAAAPSGHGEWMWRTVCSLLVLGPSGLGAGHLLSSVSRRTGWFLTGALLGSLLWALAGAHLPPIPVSFASAWLPVFWSLQAFRGRASRSPQRPRVRRPGMELLLASGVTSLALLAVGRVLLLLLGTFLPLRLWLMAVLLGAVSCGMGLAVRWPRWFGTPGWAGRGLVGAGLWLGLLELWSPLAVSFPLDVGARGMAHLENIAVFTGCLVLFPLAVLCSLSLGVLTARENRSDAPPVLTLAAGFLLALLLESVLITSGLGSGPLLTLAAACLTWAVLPGHLVARVTFSPRGWWLRVGVVVFLGLALLLSPPVPRLLLAVGALGQPQDFRRAGRSMLAPALGQWRILRETNQPAGLVQRRQRMGQASEIAWQGWKLSSDAGIRRGADAAIGLLTGVLHPGPRRGLLVGRRSAVIMQVWRQLAPEIELAWNWAVPGQRGLQPSLRGVVTARAGASTETHAGEVHSPYDLMVLRPVPPRVAASGRQWSVEVLASARGHLSPEGVLALVVPPASFTEAAFRSVLSTFLRVFPRGTLWFDGQDLLLVGSPSVLHLSLPRLENRFLTVAARVRAVGLLRATDLLSRFLLPPQGVAALARGGRLEWLLRPALPFGLAPDLNEGEGQALLARLAPTPGAWSSLLPDLSTEARQEVEAQVPVAIRATSQLLAAMGWARRDPQTALARARNGLVLRPEDPLLKEQTARLLLRMARRALLEGRVSASVSLVEQAIHLRPHWLAPRLLLQSILRLGQRQRMAGRRLNEMASLFPGSFQVLLLLAERRLDQRSWSAAATLLERARRMGYRSTDLNLNLARIAFQRRQPAAARHLIERGLAQSMNRGAALARLGAALARDGQDSVAVEYLTRSLRRGPQTPDVLGSLGELAIRRGDLAAAIAYFKRALVIQPGNGRLQLDLGSSLLLSGRAAEALGPLRQAQRLNPGHPRVHLNLAAALLHEGKREEARSQLLMVGGALADNPALRQLRHKLDLSPGDP